MLCSKCQRTLLFPHRYKKEKKGPKTIFNCPTHVNMTNTEVTKSKRMLEQRAPPSG